MISAEYTHKILEIVKMFNVSAWVSSLEQVSSGFALDKRLHVGNAYKAAVQIYVIRATRDQLHDSMVLEDLVSDVLEHLRFIPEDDYFFKATCWPTFIAGAETHNHESRRWISHRFEKGLQTLPWGYLLNAMDVLHAIWSNTNQGSTPDGVNWLTALKSSNVDWLIA